MTATATRPLVPLVPVLDVMGGRAVRAVGGRRSEYRPIRSTLADSDDPIDVARALLAATASQRLYVADLDGIVSGRPCEGTWRRLCELPCSLLIDRGIRTAEDARFFPASARPEWPRSLVVGTETLSGPSALADIVARLGPTAVSLSLDLFDGELMGDWRAWGVSSARDAEELIDRAVGDLGVREAIVLDVAQVGKREGPGTERLVMSLARRHPQLAIVAGGGVRGWADAERLHAAGASGVLVSSAVHDGRMGPDEPAA